MRPIAFLLAFALWTVITPIAIARAQARTDAYRDAVHRQHLGQFWGAVLVIDRGEVVYSGGFGLQNAENLRPIDDRSIFDIGSIAKPFTAIAVLQLVERGELSLDTTMGELFGDSSTTERTRPITVGQLLTHTSGLDDRAALQRLDFEDRDEAVRIALTSTPTAGPGERWAYCNAGYVVLAAAIEKVGGRNFEGLVREKIFQPAGMDGTGFLTGHGLDAHYFTTRELLGRGVAVRRGTPDDGWGWGLRGAGGVLTCARDLARFHAAVTTPGVLLSAESLDRMDAIAWGEAQPMATGWFADPAADGTARRRHGGGTRGYMAELRRYPDRDAMIVVMTNMRWRPDTLADALEAQLLGIQPAIARAVIDLAGLDVGQWGSVTISRPTLRVERGADDGISVVAGDGQREPLTLRLNASAARGALAQLESILATNSPNTIETTTLGLYTRPYTLDGTTLAIEGPAISPRIMPAYNGKPGPTLILHDEANSFWPLLLRLSDADAQLLAEGLANALADRK